jgi:hypothetical protein
MTLSTEEDESNGLEFSQLVAINNGTELLLYGGNLVTHYKALNLGNFARVAPFVNECKFGSLL